MTDQEIRNRWTIIRPADYDGALQPCARCGGKAQIFVVDPVGLWIRRVMPEDTVFMAARCTCGTTGKLSTTGRNVVTGNFVDELRAAEIAAKNWNAQQEG